MTLRECILDTRLDTAGKTEFIKHIGRASLLFVSQFESRSWQNFPVVDSPEVIWDTPLSDDDL
jgi:hypothetical protein